MHLNGMAVWMDHVFVREVWNGAWFTLSLAMTMFLLGVMYRRAKELKSHCTWRWWRHDLAFSLSTALAFFVFGSCLRAGYVWLWLHCSTANSTPGQCLWISKYSWVLTVAAGFAIAGGVCTIRVLSPPAWKPWSWVVVALVSVLVPIAYMAEFYIR